MTDASDALHIIPSVAEPSLIQEKLYYFFSKSHAFNYEMAGMEGVEPTTSRLTAAYSTN